MYSIILITICDFVDELYVYCLFGKIAFMY